MYSILNDKGQKFKATSLEYLIHDTDTDLWTATIYAIDKKSNMEELLLVSQELLLPNTVLDWNTLVQTLNNLGLDSIDKDSIKYEFSTYKKGQIGKNEEYYRLS